MKLYQAYELLECELASSKEEINLKFRSLSKKYHPDLNKNNEKTYKQIVIAYNEIIKHINENNSAETYFKSYTLNDKQKKEIVNIITKSYLNQEEKYQKYINENKIEEKLYHKKNKSDVTEFIISLISLII